MAIPLLRPEKTSECWVSSQSATCISASWFQVVLTHLSTLLLVLIQSINAKVPSIISQHPSPAGICLLLHLFLLCGPVQWT